MYIHTGIHVHVSNFRTVVKSLRLSWLGRFLNRTNESWQKQSQMTPLTDMEGYTLPFSLKYFVIMILNS